MQIVIYNLFSSVDAKSRVCSCVWRPLATCGRIMHYVRTCSTTTKEHEVVLESCRERLECGESAESAVKSTQLCAR